MSEQKFDIVVLGGGSGGYAAALRATELGFSVALIEKDKVGGTCLHRGCIPTKALLHAAEVADVSRESEKFGVRSTFEGIDLPSVKEYRDEVVQSKFKGLQGLLKARKITTIAGEGRLTSPTTVQVGDDTIVGDKVVLATGSYSRTLPGLEIGGRVITSETALALDWIPNKVVILGGGVIGVEFASVWKSFGADVQIVEALPHLVPNEDEAISKQFERAFRKRGIQFNLGTRFSGVTQDDQGVVVTLEDGKTFEGDILLVAVGRGPATQGLGFEEAGITVDRGFVITNDRLETSVPGVYAVGDIVPGLQLAHRGFQQGIFVAEEIAGLNPQIVEDVNIPKVTYSEPEVASVGLTEAKAAAQYGADSITAYDYSLAGNGKSHILGTSGSIKVVRVNDGPVVGVHMIGARVGELIGEAQLVVNWEAYPEDIAPLVHAHPTQNEALGEAFLALAGKPLHAL
ncbi:dihydrolipoyl dehydrogenase [Humibacter sp. BT305]|uniref:Dihydrolipoyl dehydrogenase n=1 Tax=Cnuibacter physcomitrellae TaxID=1619308 RepID=A0A1X9LJW9_9MICO|nr:dihydrolipoyl dehydrogenase [Cnuibacter physcomitrellae]ARJ05473.1 dihydrolipoyl dehydrogenase [Cnuibacter physcomitrellae]AXH35886.1 dihydrolipoyl dehydrogenase [Humibacter sp. BT305]MCS5496827.1 dihydrolipoyl dehydrogenase [Cnuibacter physcomitrellae]GGI35769.1 dihydrolipoyl dehydrogenase [Cnuibacter physcomitrellae]